MTQHDTCTQCLSTLPGGVRGGLCPACLLKRGLESQSAGALSVDPSTPTHKWEPPAVDQIAPLFPELDILELVGRGGMGAVYKAREKQLDRLVALKILPPEIGREEAFAQRFAREAQAMARLGHPNIATIHAFGSRKYLAGAMHGVTRAAEGEGAPRDDVQSDAAPKDPALNDAPGELYYLLMEYVDGLSLRQLLDAGTVTAREALAIVPQICDALQYAHDRGIVHRDIKPENILLNRSGQVKIADFGLAKLVGRMNARDEINTDEAGSKGAPGLTSGQGQGDASAGESLVSIGGQRVMGTPHYMAPEQIQRPREVDHRADIYSLGVVFYQMLTGELPKGKFDPPSRLVRIDVRLDEVVLRALEREPGRRYQQVSEVRTQIQTIALSPAEGLALGEQDQARVHQEEWWLRYVSVVGQRQGRAVINWPGVWRDAVGIIGLFCIGWVIARVAHPAWVPTSSRLLLLPILLLLIPLVIVIGLRRPVERLTPLDDPAEGDGAADSGLDQFAVQQGGMMQADSSDAVGTGSISQSTGASSKPLSLRASLAVMVGIAVVLVVLSLLTVKWDSKRASQQTAGNDGPTTAMITGDPWKVTLASGVTVELLGVAESPARETSSWWKPDGSPLATRPFDHWHPGDSIQAPERDWRKRDFGIRLGDLPKSGFVVKLKSDQASSTMYTVQQRDLAAGTELWGLSAGFPKELTKTRLQVGVAAGEWTTLNTLPKSGRSGSSGSGYVLLGSPVQAEKNHVSITISHDMNDRDFRLIAIDTQGQEHQPVQSDTHGLTMNTITQFTYSFEGMTEEDIKEFQFQTRPYEWAEYPEVALEPGVEVVAPVRQPPEIPTSSATLPSTADKPSTRPATTQGNNDETAKYSGVWVQDFHPGEDKVSAEYFGPDGISVWMGREGDKILTTRGRGKVIHGRTYSQEDGFTHPISEVYRAGNQWYLKKGALVDVLELGSPIPPKVDSPEMVATAQLFLVELQNKRLEGLKLLSIGDAMGWVSDLSSQDHAEYVFPGIHAQILEQTMDQMHVQSFAGNAKAMIRIREVAVEGGWAAASVNLPEKPGESVVFIFRQTPKGWRFVDVKMTRQAVDKALSAELPGLEARLKKAKELIINQPATLPAP